MKYLIKNAKVIDPVNKLNGQFDILLENGKIKQVAKSITDKTAKIIDAKAKTAVPGFIDMHTHFREPGFEDKETIATGSRSALKGGFTSVAVMPNTYPVMDLAENIKLLKNIIAKKSQVKINIVAAITKGRKGEQIADLESYKKLGITAISDDGNSIADDRIMRLAIKQAKEKDLLIIAHCEDKKLSGDGVMNKGFISSKIGLKGIPKQAEYEIVKRDIELAKGLDAKIHIAHVSCSESCAIIKQAKKEGVKVTAETAPHYFTLTEENCQSYDTRTKMNPPLRTKKDVEAIKQAIAEGTIDVIATDHAPHAFHDKYVEFDKADFGIIGLETALPLAYEKLVETKLINFAKLVELMSVNPAKILGLEIPQIKAGVAADITILDLDAEYKLTADDIVSKSKNSPFLKRKLKGRADYIFVNGKLNLKEGKLI
jgi:dihydroorotase